MVYVTLSIMSNSKYSRDYPSTIRAQCYENYIFKLFLLVPRETITNNEVPIDRSELARKALLKNCLQELAAI